MKKLFFLILFLIFLIFVFNNLSFKDQMQIKSIATCGLVNGKFCESDNFCAGLKIGGHPGNCCMGFCYDIDWKSCDQDSDCIRVNKTCCSFSRTAINKKYEQKWSLFLHQDGCYCQAWMPRPSIDWFAKPVCVENKCVLDLEDSSVCENEETAKRADLCYSLFDKDVQEGRIFDQPR